MLARTAATEPAALCPATLKQAPVRGMLRCRSHHRCHCGPASVPGRGADDLSTLPGTIALPLSARWKGVFGEVNATSISITTSSTNSSATFYTKYRKLPTTYVVTAFYVNKVGHCAAPGALQTLRT